MHNLLPLMRQRHSCRTAFDPNRPIPNQAMLELLEAARWAPTAHNMQNFEAIVIDDPAVLTAIGEVRAPVSEIFLRENYQQFSFSDDALERKKTGVLASLFPTSWGRPEAWKDIANAPGRCLGDILQGAPALMILLYDQRKRAPASEGDVLGIMSLGCVMQNVWLMSAALGMGMQILSSFAAADVEGPLRRILGFPDYLRIALAARVGYPLGAPDGSLRVRRDIQDFTHQNHY